MNTSLSPEELDILAERDPACDEIFGVPSRSRKTKYPVKLLRYLFPARLLGEELTRRHLPVRVCEIGVDRGQMLLFTRHYFTCKFDATFLARHVAHWSAVSARIHDKQLRAHGYDSWLQANVESPEFSLPGRYDVVIVSHLLEHLYDPESAMRTMVDHLNPGGMILGGMPVTPDFAASFWETRIRKRAGPFGHVSVFSPRRIMAVASDNKLDCDFLTGAYFVRCTGSRLENARNWIMANLAFGARFPGWPGEIYWRMRRVLSGLFVPLVLCLNLDA